MYRNHPTHITIPYHAPFIAPTSINFRKTVFFTSSSVTANQLTPRPWRSTEIPILSKPRRSNRPATQAAEQIPDTSNNGSEVDLVGSITVSDEIRGPYRSVPESRVALHGPNGRNHGTGALNGEKYKNDVATHTINTINSHTQRLVSDNDRLGTEERA